MSDTNLPARAPRPREQLPITLFEGVVLAARADDGRIYIGLRDMCDTLGLKVSGQRRRILADEALHLVQFRVQAGGQFRTLDFLLLEDVPVWLLGVQQLRVIASAQERFAYVKLYLVRAVQRAFAELTGLPDAPSSEIEDLTDLDRIGQAFAQLAELGQRQDGVESRLDRARGAFRDLRALLAELHARVQELERQAKATAQPNPAWDGVSDGAAVGCGTRRARSEVDGGRGYPQELGGAEYCLRGEHLHPVACCALQRDPQLHQRSVSGRHRT